LFKLLVTNYKYLVSIKVIKYIDFIAIFWISQVREVLIVLNKNYNFAYRLI